jgi:hypothetical protein
MAAMNFASEIVEKNGDFGVVDMRKMLAKGTGEKRDRRRELEGIHRRTISRNGWGGKESGNRVLGMVEEGKEGGEMGVGDGGGSSTVRRR